MADESYPFDAGSGFTVSEDQWRAYARRFAFTGIAGSGSAAAVTAGTGAQIVRSAAPLGAMVDGVFWRDTAARTLSVPPNAAANPRIDRVVLRLDPTANKIDTAILQGTPAANPSPPALAADTVGLFDVPLAQYRLPASGGAQNPTNITDERLWSRASHGPWTRGFGSGARVDRATERFDTVEQELWVAAGSTYRIRYTARFYVDGTSWQTVSPRLQLNGLSGAPPDGHFNVNFPSISGDRFEGYITYDWEHTASETRRATIKPGIYASTGSPDIVWLQASISVIRLD